jgi:hypothetical protein
MSDLQPIKGIKNGPITIKVRNRGAVQVITLDFDGAKRLIEQLQEAIGRLPLEAWK